MTWKMWDFYWLQEFQFRNWGKRYQAKICLLNEKLKYSKLWQWLLGLPGQLQPGYGKGFCSPAARWNPSLAEISSKTPIYCKDHRISLIFLCRSELDWVFSMKRTMFPEWVVIFYITQLWSGCSDKNQTFSEFGCLIETWIWQGKGQKAAVDIEHQ